RRALQALLVMLVVALIAFTLFRFVGDPINQMVGLETSAAERAQLREALGLNDPVIVQFGRFVWRALHLDFGISYQFKQPVVTLIAERFPATIELAFVSTLLALLLGIPMGVHTALHRGSWLSTFLLTVSLIGISLPVFLTGILLIFLFAVTLGVLPSFGRGEVVRLGFWTTGLLTASGLRALVLPAVTLGLFQLTLVMRLVRSEMLEVLRTDYIKFARARGLSARAINFGHALKNTLVPVITIVGLQLGSVIAFAIITETVFQWPGMGLLFLIAVQNADIPVMAAYLLLVAAIFVTINLIVDLLYAIIDPRIRVEARSAGVGVDAPLPSSETSRAPSRLAAFFDHDVVYSFTRSKVTIVAALVTLIIVLAAALAPWIAPHDPFDLRQLSLLDSHLPPAWLAEGDRRFLLGSDDQGRDVLSAILYGARISLSVGLLSVALAAVLGIALGLIAGYAGGALDSLIMRAADVQLTFPAILIALLIDGTV